MTPPADPRHPRAHRLAVALYAPLLRWRLQRRRGSALPERIARAVLACTTHGLGRRP